MPSLLFVDDDPRILAGTRRQLRRRRPEWTSSFAEGGPEAVFALESDPYDVLICDLKMPGVDGASVLAHAAEHYPDTVRVVMSGHADRDVALRTVTVAHQFLAKPCEASEIRDVLDRILALRESVDPALRSALGGVTHLPCAPSGRDAVLARLGEAATTDEVAPIVATDPALASLFLKVVGSDFLGRTPAVTSVPRALKLLGLETVRALASSLAKPALSPGVIADVEDVRDRARRLSTVADHLVEPDRADLARTLAVLHMVPHLVRCVVPGAFDELGPDALAELGTYLLGIQGLPRALVEDAAAPPSFDHLGAAEIIQLSEGLVREASGGEPLDRSGPERLGLADRLEGWRAFAAEVVGRPLART